MNVARAPSPTNSYSIEATGDGWRPAPNESFQGFVQSARRAPDCRSQKDSIQQMFSESTAADISGRPDPDSRHDSPDGVDDLRRDALRLLGATLGLFEAGEKLPQSLLCSWRFAAAVGRHRISSTTPCLFCGCHV
jgi:hypothetical protein